MADDLDRQIDDLLASGASIDDIIAEAKRELASREKSRGSAVPPSRAAVAAGRRPSPDLSAELVSTARPQGGSAPRATADPATNRTGKGLRPDYFGGLMPVEGPVMDPEVIDEETRERNSAIVAGGYAAAGAGMVGGPALMGQMTTLPTRLIGAAGLASGTNAVGAGTTEALEGRNPLPAMQEAAWRTDIPGTEDAWVPTPLLGAGLQAVGEAAGAVAGKIRNSPGTTGQDIRLLEQHGASPSPVPFRPVKNPPSERMGVQPNSEGRGVVGERAARTMQRELDVQERLNLQRLNNVEKPAALAKQGDRAVSVEELLPEIDAAIADPKYKALGLEEKLKSVRAMLAGEMEPTMEIHAARPSKAGGSVGSVEERLESPIEIFTGQPEAVTTSRAPVFVHHGGKVAPRERFATGGLSAIEAEAIPGGPQNTVSGRAVTFDPGEPTVISSVERPGFQSSATSAGGHEPVVVPMGDVRNRVGDAPNRVMSAKQLDRLRQALDEVGAAAAFAIGERDAKKLPLYGLANRVRGLVRKEAPAIGLANRRAADRGRKLEVTRERMKSDDPESLGMQIASLGEEGSKYAGTRKERLAALRRHFPVSDHLTREQLDAALDAPRLLLAEERLHLKQIPRIGSGGSDAMNLIEPLLARGIYPSARAVAPAARASAPYVPFFTDILDAYTRR